MSIGIESAASFMAAKNQAQISNALAARFLKSEAAQASQIVELLKAGSDSLQAAANAINAPTLDGTGASVDRSI